MAYILTISNSDIEFRHIEDKQNESYLMNQSAPDIRISTENDLRSEQYVMLVHQVEGGSIPEAPNDGKLYGRKNKQWSRAVEPAEVAEAISHTLEIAEEEIAEARAYAESVAEAAYQAGKSDLDDATRIIAAETGRIDTRLTTVDEELTEKIGQAEEKIAEAKVEIGVAEQEIEYAKQEISEAKQEIVDTKQDIEVAKGRIFDAENEIINAKERISTAESDISRVETSIDETKGEVAVQAERLDVAEGTLTNVGTRLSAAEGTITSHASEINTVTGQIGEVTTELDAHNARITANASRIDTESGRITEAEIAIDGANARITAQAENIDAVTGRITTAEQEIDAVEGSVTTLVSRVDTAEGTLTTVGTRLDAAEGSITSQASQIDTITGEISEVNTTLDAHNTRITANATRIDTEAGRITSAETAIDGANARIDAQAESIDTLTGRVSSAEVAIDGANARIDLQAEEIDTVNNRVSSAEIAIDGAGARIDLLAEEVQTAEGSISSLGTRMDAAEGTITTFNNWKDTATGQITTMEEKWDNIDATITTTVATQMQIPGSAIKTGVETVVDGKAGSIVTTAVQTVTQDIDGILEESANFSQVSQDTNGLKAVVGDATNGLVHDVSALEQTSTEISARVTSTEEALDDGEGGLLNVGEIKVTADEVSASVKNGDNYAEIIARINSATGASEVLLNASKIYLLGETVAEKLTALEATIGNLTLENALVHGTVESIINGTTMWQLKNDGTGSLAKGNIHWDANGNATFTGDVVATSLSLGSTVTIPSDNISGLSAIATSGNYDDIINPPHIPGDSEITGLVDTFVKSNGILDLQGNVGSLITNYVTTRGYQTASDVQAALEELDYNSVSIVDSEPDDKGIITRTITVIPHGGEASTYTEYYSQDGKYLITDVGYGSGHFDDRTETAKGVLISTDGLLKAKNAIIYGTIYSHAGQIGGWTINNSSLSSGNVVINGDGNISNQVDGQTYPFWHLDANGAGGVAKNNIHWDQNGTVYLAQNIQIGDNPDLTLALISKLSYFLAAFQPYNASHQKIDWSSPAAEIAYVKTPYNFCSELEITAGGVGESGGGTTGIDRIFFGDTKYQAEEGSLAINIPLTGTNGIKGVLGITALEQAIETAGKVDDVKVDGVSVVTNKVANISLSGYATESWVLGKSYITASALTPYRTSSAQDAIDAALELSLATNIAAISGRVTSIEEWFASPQLDELLVKDLSVTHAINLNGYDITGAKATAWDAHLTNTSNPHSVTWSQVKPSDGVPLADLASGVQTSLGRADTAYDWGDWRTRVGTLEGYFTSGKAKDADKLDGNDSTYFAAASRVTTLEGYFTDGSVKKALQLTTTHTIWGKDFNGTQDVTGDMLGVGKIDFTAKTSASTSGNVLEVVNIGTSSNPVYALHTTLPFYSDNEITAGGIGQGGGGGDVFSTVAYASLASLTSEEMDKVPTAWAAKKLQDRIIVLEGKATAVSYTPSVSSGTALGTITIDNVGHTIYAPTIPTALKNPYSLTFGSKTYDGSAAKTITASDLGALTSHQTVTLASGTNNGTLKLTTNAGTVDNIAVKGLAALAFKASLVASDIPSLDASKITTGQFADARIASASVWNAKIDTSALGNTELSLAANIAALEGRLASIGCWFASPSLSELLVRNLGVKDMINLCGYDITLGKVGEWDGKQDAISDLATIRSRADEGHTAYGWGNWATRMGNVESRATSLEGRATSLEGRATNLETRATTLEGYFSGGIAKKATADASGNVITTTYQTIANTNAAELALSTGVASVESRVASIEQWMRSMSADDLLVKILNIVNMLNLGGVNIKVNTSGEVEIAGNLRTIGNIVATGEITAGA